MNKSWRSAWCKKAELSDRADADTTKEAPHGNYVLLSFGCYKKTISYCVKDGSGPYLREGSLPANTLAPEIWMKTLRSAWTAAMEADHPITSWIYRYLKPHAAAVKVAHPLMLAHRGGRKRTIGIGWPARLPTCLGAIFLPDATWHREIRERRRTLRYRNLLVATVQMKNKIAGGC